MSSTLPMELLQPPYLCLRFDKRGWYITANGIRIRPLPDEITNHAAACFWLLDIYRLYYPPEKEHHESPPLP